MIKMNKEMTVTAVKTFAKAQVMEDIMNFLIEKYGEENAKMVRFGTSTSKKNEIGVRFDSVETEDGEVNDMVVTVNVTASPCASNKICDNISLTFFSEMMLSRKDSLSRISSFLIFTFIFPPPLLFFYNLFFYIYIYL